MKLGGLSSKSVGRIAKAIKGEAGSPSSDRILEVAGKLQEVVSGLEFIAKDSTFADVLTEKELSKAEEAAESLMSLIYETP